MIVSAQNSKIKFVRALLGGAKARRAESAFVAEGVRLVEEAANNRWGFRFVLYDETLSGRGKSDVENLRSRGIECEEISPSLMKSLSDTETSQGILAVLDHSLLPFPRSPNFVLVPDQIRDPGNLGTLIRSADAAGVDAALIPPETADPFAPKVVRAGMGAHFRLPILSMGWEEIARRLDGLQVYLADMEGKSCWQADLRVPLALIVGGEAEGASAAARRLATRRVKIPMAGKAESLNAAVAGSVLMFEAMRQKTVISNQ